MDNIWCQV